MTPPDEETAARLLGEHADIVGRPTFRDGQLTHAWLRRDVPAERYAALLTDPLASALEEIALYGGTDAGPVLEAIATHRPASLVSLRFGATEDVDLSAWWGHLRGFTRLALSGSVFTGPIDAPALRFLGWVDRRGTGVSFGSSTLAVHEVWMRTPRNAAAAFFDAVETPDLRTLTVDARLDAPLVDALQARAGALPKLERLAAGGLSSDSPAADALRQAFPGVVLSEPA
jgi:hypothetical protein